MKKDFSELFKIIYDYFKNSEAAREFGSSKLAMAKFLEVSQGKMQHWEKGNWPNTPDIALLHSKLGFAYHWLVTGEGEPLAQGTNIEPQDADLRAELDQMKRELDEERRLNRQLTTRLLIDGVGDKDGQNSTGKAGDGHGR